jgi:hypothetical protein
VTRKQAPIIVTMAALAAAVTATIVFAASSGMPDRYRYTGWMSPVYGAHTPKHVMFEGDAGTLLFADAYNLTQARTAYQVCVRNAQSGRKRFCASGTAPPDTRPSVVPLPDICCGDFVAIWTVTGHEVARWPFRYAPEGA